MSTRWLEEHRRDGWYRRAKREGYRSRAAYKLLQLHDRFHLLEEGDRVVDLGCAPGGWSQVAVELVGDAGRVVGVDLDPVRELPGAVFLVGDLTEEATVKRVAEAVDGAADAVLSDMSPDITGSYSTDHARSVHLAREALRFALQVLRPGGCFVAKVFQGDLFEGFLEDVGARFTSVQGHSPPASRAASSEMYVVAKGLHREAEPLPRAEEDGAGDEGWDAGVPPPSRRGNR